MAENKELEVINIRQILKVLWKGRKTFYKTLPAVFLISCIYIVFVPRYYTCSVMLAPETEAPNTSGMLGSLASSFGFDIGSLANQDAISPILYPDLMESNDFVVSLFPVQVTTEDGELTTSYYDYISNHQKASPWSMPLIWTKNLINSMFEDKEEGGEEKINPFRLTRQQEKIAKAMRSNITCSVDKKTDVITIMVNDQDPLICATLADSVRTRLQDFITDYRTNKARIDLEYYKRLTAEAKADYEKVRRQYVSMSDANNDIILKSVQSKIADMENDMQLKYNTYNVLNTQLQAARAKVQERTPAFTVLQGATVPLKATGPKRMLFVIGMVLLTFVGTSIYLSRKTIHLKF
ncbi:hypothetical protein [Xylanibacter brevis]|uniref:hypothetical protein n=1 Tax=Xylanibacter brevis TaxID=83231 RepID=UPI000480FD24|nr:hypothetical protein [Xylanibacter brevis]